MSACQPQLDTSIVIAAAVIFATMVLLGLGAMIFARGIVPQTSGITVIKMVGEFVLAMVLVCGCGVLLWGIAFQGAQNATAIIPLVCTTVGAVAGFYFRGGTQVQDNINSGNTRQGGQP